MVVEMLASERFQSRCFGLAMSFRMYGCMFQNNTESGSLGTRSCSDSPWTENFGVAVAELLAIYLEEFSIPGRIRQRNCEATDGDLKAEEDGLSNMTYLHDAND
jgi:hypothetical protein